MALKKSEATDEDIVSDVEAWAFRTRANGSKTAPSDSSIILWLALRGGTFNIHAVCREAPSLEHAIDRLSQLAKHVQRIAKRHRTVDQTTASNVCRRIEIVCKHAKLVSTILPRKDYSIEDVREAFRVNPDERLRVYRIFEVAIRDFDYFGGLTPTQIDSLLNMGSKLKIEADEAIHSAVLGTERRTSGSREEAAADSTNTSRGGIDHARSNGPVNTDERLLTALKTLYVTPRPAIESTVTVDDFRKTLDGTDPILFHGPLNASAYLLSFLWENGFANATFMREVKRKHGVELMPIQPVDVAKTIRRHRDQGDMNKARSEIVEFIERIRPFFQAEDDSDSSLTA